MIFQTTRRLMRSDEGADGLSLISCTAFVGMTLGLGETARVFWRVHSLSPLEIGLLLLYGCGGYALLSVAIAAGWLLIRPKGVSGSEVASGQAIGAAVAAFLSVQFLAALAGLGQPKLSWLIPGCILSAIACGTASGWIASRLAILRKPLFWTALAAGFLVTGLVFAARVGEKRM